jgi:hypothetical protein
MITLHDVEQFIPFLKPLFEGMRAARDFFRRNPDRKKSGHAIDIPKKTLIFLPEIHPFAVAWGLAKIGDKPGMQITARLQATNTSQYGIRPSGAKLLDPKGVEIIQHMLLVVEPDIDTDGSTNIIPTRSIGRVSLHFIVTPVTGKPGQPMHVKILVLDQFGNEHPVDLQCKFMGSETI